MSNDLTGEWVIKPGAGRIAVMTGGAPEKIGSIYIPQTSAPEKPTVGKVVADGGSYTQDGVEYEPLYPVGAWVVFGRYTGTKVTVNRQDVLIIMEKDVLCELVPASEADARPAPNVIVHGKE